MFVAIRQCASGALALFIFACAAFAGSPSARIGEDGTAALPLRDAALIVSYATNVAGGMPEVAIVASASTNVTDPFFIDPRDRLIESGLFSGVTVFNAGAMTPTAEQLQPFDAVLVWSNFDFADPNGLGDVLADYVDSGGGVVLAVFATSSDDEDRVIAGRWMTNEYAVIAPAGGTTTGTAALGAVPVPPHPIMNGVTTFSGGSGSFRPTTRETAPSAQVIAEWTDGSILAAVREDTVGARIDLGMYPPSDTVLPGFWDATTDGGALLAGALRYAADRSPLLPGDSDHDGDVDVDDAARFDACYVESSEGLVPAGCVTFDFDHDGDVDCADWNRLNGAWTDSGALPNTFDCTLVVPTVSDWGLVVLSLALLIMGSALIVRPHGP